MNIHDVRTWGLIAAMLLSLASGMQLCSDLYRALAPGISDTPGLP